MYGHVSSHEKLYVTLSQKIVQFPTKVLVKKEELERIIGIDTQKVVYKKCFISLIQFTVQFCNSKDVVIHHK